MCDCVVMGDLCCTKEACHEPRQRAFPREQDPNPLTILFAEELGRERDNGARLPSGIGSNKEMHSVQLTSFARLSLGLRVRLAKRLRFAEKFCPRTKPRFIEIPRFVGT